mmetsp:Transcript_10699/g.12907  ORF Transcript_10699/g.12907 Transcript_10699/m.12907 type:complete len:417 (-) Transcript_10699:173-1423(-)
MFRGIQRVNGILVVKTLYKPVLNISFVNAVARRSFCAQPPDLQVVDSLNKIKKRLDSQGVAARIEELKLELNREDLWDDPKKAGATAREHASLQEQFQLFTSIKDRYEAAIELTALAEEENKDGDTADPENVQILEECAVEIEELASEAQRFALELLLDGPADKMGCLMEFTAGAGGTESCEFSMMLLNMYKNFADARGYSTAILDTVPGQEAGIRSGVLKITGDNVYGWMRTETGVHRLVRISPYDTQNRRQTAFASVAVTPLGSDGEESNMDIEIDQTDLVIETYRSSGPGGQHANTTASAVRILHTPTGLKASSQSQRSQHQNKAAALMVLKSRLMEMKIREKRQEKMAFIESLGDTGWGNQIRSYVLNPYQMVKDHRTNHETPQAEKVLAGEPKFLSPFLEASLLQSDSEQT